MGMQIKMKVLLGFLGLLLIPLFNYPVQAKINIKKPAFPEDCSAIKAQFPHADCGVYVIQPAGSKAPFKVYCEMWSPDSWIVVQRRSGGSVSFYKGWDQYRDGFGDKTYDHWLGLEKLHILTKDMTKSWTLRIDLWDHEDGYAYAEYSNFRIGDEKTAYRLHVGKYTGTAGDAIRGTYQGIDQNGSGFSTFDRDNDKCSPCIYGDIAFDKCTEKHGSGWWYSGCGSAALNGDWHPSDDPIGWGSGLNWRTWKPMPYSAKASRMMIKSD